MFLFMFLIDFSTFIMIFFIGIGLSIDAMLVSVSNSISYKIFSFRDAVFQSLVFAICQGIAPIIGYFLGYAIKDELSSFDHWIAFFLLSLVGIGMLFQKKDTYVDCILKLSGIALIIQGISTSIDALAIGVSFAMLEINIIVASFIIGIITFILCLISSVLGIVVGYYLGDQFQENITYFGGILLILIGINILVNHLVF